MIVPFKLGQFEGADISAWDFSIPDDTQWATVSDFSTVSGLSTDDLNAALDDLQLTVRPEDGAIIDSMGNTIDWANLISKVATIAGPAASLIRTLTGNPVVYRPGQVIPAGYHVVNGQLVPIAAGTGLFGTMSNSMSLVLIGLAAFLLLRK